jgi:hypothetical protein
MALRRPRHFALIRLRDGKELAWQPIPEGARITEINLLEAILRRRWAVDEQTLVLRDSGLDEGPW